MQGETYKNEAARSVTMLQHTKDHKSAPTPHHSSSSFAQKKNPGQQKPAPAVLRCSSSPSSQHLRHPFTHMAYPFVPPHALVEQPLPHGYELAQDNELDQWEQKRGGFYQHDTAQSLKCSFLDEKRVRLRHSAESIARAELTDLGIDATPLNLAAIKLLRSS